MALTKMVGGNWFTQVGHPFVANELPVAAKFTSASGFQKACADTETNARAVGIVVAIDGPSIRVATTGDIIDVTGMGLALDTDYYLSDALSGKNITAVKPIELNNIHVPLFRTSNTNTAYVNIEMGMKIVDPGTGAGVSDGIHDDIIVANNGASYTVKNSAITNAKLANMPAMTTKANNAGGSDVPKDLTVAQIKAMYGLTDAEIQNITFAGLRGLPGSGPYLFKDASGAFSWQAAGGASAFTPSAPTQPVMDDINDTANWTNNPSYPLVSDYEWRINAGAATAVTSKPIAVGGVAGTVEVRVKAKDGNNASAWLTIGTFTATSGSALFRETFPNNSIPLTGTGTNHDVGTVGWRRTLQATPSTDPASTTENNPATSTTTSAIYSGKGKGSTTAVHANDAGLYDDYEAGGEYGFYNSNGKCRRQLVWTDKYSISANPTKVKFYLGCESADWRARPAFKVGTQWYVYGAGVTTGAPFPAAGDFSDSLAGGSDTDGAELKEITIDRASTTQWYLLQNDTTKLLMGAATGAALPAGSITAFGLYFENKPGGVYTDSTAYIRFDSFEIQ